MSTRKKPDPYVVGQYIDATSAIGGQAYLWATQDNVTAVRRGDYFKIQPIAAEYDLSTRCIYHCPWCAYRESKSQAHHSMVQHDDEHAEAVVDVLAKAGVRLLVLTGGGEPLLSSSLEKVILRARQLGMVVTLYTNGFLLKARRAKSLLNAGISEVRMSLNDVSSQNGYDIAHGSPPGGKLKFSVVLDNLIYLLNQRNESGVDTNVGCSFVLAECSATNLEQSLTNLSSRLRQESLSIDYTIIRPAVDYWPESRDKYARFLGDPKAQSKSIYAALRNFYETSELGHILCSPQRFQSLSTEASGPAYQRCLGFQSWLNIGPDGTAYVCCETKHDRKYSMGNILKCVSESSAEKLFSAPIACHMREDEGSTTHCPTRLCKPSAINAIFAEIEDHRDPATGTLPEYINEWLSAVEVEAGKQHANFRYSKAPSAAGV